MLEELLIHHCAPTLAGVKTASLFTAPYLVKEDIDIYIRKLNDSLKSKGVNIIPVYYFQNKVLIYVYRPSYLRQDFENCNTRFLLDECGYKSKDTDICLAQLIKKFSNISNFPHEIGLFLGYPPEDVAGFIKNNACNFKCIGYWKVYDNEERAKKTFKCFKLCSEIYRTHWSKGKTIQQLTVNI